MGDHKIDVTSTKAERIAFIRHLLDDIKSLEYMLDNNLIEDDIVRIGAEQEFCLVNSSWRPANNAVEILERINDQHFTTELAKYNLEINLDPVKLEKGAFKQVKNQLDSLLNEAKKHAEEKDSKVLLTGILPTISMHELDIDYMTPAPRYYALNDVMTAAKGSDFRMHFNGVDELSIKHNSVMFEACNTSFQLHLQISPNDFESSYNWSQAIAGPVLGVSVNSPLLLGNELWSETRIALFQQSIDTRKVSYSQVNKRPRVTFGDAWVKGSVAHFYKDEISKYRIILTKEIEKNSLEELAKGNAPKLKALNLHNGTIYRWNRPCYGVGGGKAHIRIENRYIPAGPTTTDEMANFAFWIGLMKGRPEAYDQTHAKMDFEDAKSNFIHAARYGSETIMKWMGKRICLEKLVLDELLPIAKIGLEKMQIDSDDIELYLGIIRDRFAKATGAQWLVENYRRCKKKYKQDDALAILTKGIYDNQQTYQSIREWPAEIDLNRPDSFAKKVGHIMNTSLVTADQEDAASLTLNFMKWNDIHHLPVVDRHGGLKGIITWQHLSKYLNAEDLDKKAAEDIMVESVITTTPSMSIQEAIDIMKSKEIGSLPVIRHNLLVGIITIKDLIPFTND